jgi:predicted GNAT family acetyltransferase
MTWTIVHNTTSDRFETIVEGNVCVIDYRRDGNIIELTHVGVPGPVENRGIASALTQAAFDWARTEGLQIVPKCPYAVAWIKRHRDYRSVLRAPK